ncbi:glycosyltransferase family 39 protein [Cerasicoccus maritimus]|uniref:glycosyltransferase family 39 protein n=1 Tax=Cerasicoccus maritimus TaxID=490089 RepID=UPI002852B18C|nr:glycosyltransferase family 39 protein [Cerasicoccus maritimus]
MSEPPPRSSRANAYLWAVFGLGAVLRLIQYAVNRSFWQDEVSLAINVIERDFSQLAEPLASNQAAPYLVLVLFKAAHALFGANDYAFRFVPLAFSLAGLAFFVPLTRRLLDPRSALAAMLLLAISPTAVSFSIEYKQYTIDSFATIWILLALAPLMLGQRTRRHFVHAAIAGAVCVWLSFPAVFVLAGTGLAVIYAQWKHWQKFALPLTLVALWIIFFAGHYALIATNAAGNDDLASFWAGHMLPPPTSLDNLATLWQKMVHIADYALPYPWSAAPLLMAYAGFAWIARKRPIPAAAIGLPFLAIMGASMLELYPLYSRLILFLQPLVCLAAGACLGGLANLGQRWPKLKIPGHAVAGLLVLPLAYASAQDVIEPPEKQATQSVARTLAEARQPEQPILVRPLEAQQLRFYAERYGIPSDVIIRRSPNDDDPSDILSTLYPVDGQTLVWIFVLQRFGEPNIAQYNIEQRVRPTGRILGHQHYAMCDLYLIDLTGLKPPEEPREE